MKLTLPKGSKPLLFITPSDIVGGLVLLILLAFLFAYMLAHTAAMDRRAQCSYFGGTIINDQCIYPKGTT